MAVQWRNDVNSALEEAKKSGKPLLLDFISAPM
jgi:hypothetical protein